MKNVLTPSLVLALSLATSSAHAFCGFYVSGADQSLYNDATMVVMMRDGTKTVLSMQNNYQGPAEAFAMVVPVPVVLQEENVKTLPREIFSRVDNLAAPRLVEYWEQDPCAPVYDRRRMRRRTGAPVRPSASAGRPGGHGVTIEAEFSVGEYDIVILSAEDSSGLNTWLREERYNIPDGAEGVLRGYVEAGTKFFVAKVDPTKVTFADGRAVLSPLRFHYESETFSLPVRLGLLNAQGKQDVIVHVLAKNQRYEVANYENVTIPTNIRVLNGVRDNFGEFYESLFSAVVEQNPRTVVTEYSWQATSCDPCPQTPLQANELATLGADVIDGLAPPGPQTRPASRPRRARPRPGSGFFGGGSAYVLTRLHYRYGRDDLGEDLVFRPAPAIVGGRGTPNADGEMEEREAAQSGSNNFQGRYVILHPFEGEVTCEQPNRGRWGGPPGGGANRPRAAANPRLTGGAVPTAQPLANMITDNIASLNMTATPPSNPSEEPTAEPVVEETPAVDPVPEMEEPPAASPSGCGGCVIGAADPAGFALIGFFALFFANRRR